LDVNKKALISLDTQNHFLPKLLPEFMFSLGVNIQYQHEESQIDFNFEAITGIKTIG